MTKQEKIQQNIELLNTQGYILVDGVGRIETAPVKAKNKNLGNVRRKLKPVLKSTMSQKDLINELVKLSTDDIKNTLANNNV